MLAVSPLLGIPMPRVPNRFKASEDDPSISTAAAPTSQSGGWTIPSWQTSPWELLSVRGVQRSPQVALSSAGARIHLAPGLGTEISSLIKPFLLLCLVFA